ncbi:MAG: 50S ribosomal protein L11 methyltransferase [Thermodesulfovibrionales bacterium]
MGYYEFVIRSNDESKDAIINCLSELNCLGFHERQGDIIAYFIDNIDVNSIREVLASLKPRLEKAGLDDRLTFDYSYLSERDWNEPWKKRFVPVDIGERLRIIPPWEKKAPSRLNIIVDPGMAFGTGHHETTRDCLLLIERYSAVIKRERFLDIGAGTGILAIAASILGFKKVIGIDIDPLAIDAAKRNVGLNKLSNVDIEEKVARDIEGQFDMIVANLMSEVLISIAGEVSRLLDRAGVAILSGMLDGQEIDVVNEMERYGLNVIESLHNNKWESVVVRRTE